MNSYTRNYNFGYHSTDDQFKGNNNYDGACKMIGFNVVEIVYCNKLKISLILIKSA